MANDMKINFIILISLILVLFPPALSAKNIKISGRVIDDQGTPMPYSTIVVTDYRDSVVFVALVDDEEGKFSFSGIKIDEKKYTFTFSNGFNLKKSIVVTGKDCPKEVDFGDVVLEQYSQMLAEATVTGGNKGIRRADRTIYVIDSTYLDRVVVTEDLLDKIPLVTADPLSHSASILGAENTYVMLNGINTGRSVDLRRINYRDIEKVEIIHVPTGFLAGQGYDGVINIVLKPEIRTGVDAGFEEFLRLPSTDNDFYAGFTYGSGDVKFELLYSNYYRVMDNRYKSTRSDKFAELEYVMDGIMNDGKELDHTIDFNLDWHITPDDYFNITTNTMAYSTADKTTMYEQYYRDMDGNNLANLSPFSTRYAYEQFNGNYTVFYKHTMREKKTDYLTVNANIGYNRSKDLSQTVYEQDGREIVNTEFSDRLSVTLESEYHNKINDIFTFDAGIRGYYRRFNSDVKEIANSTTLYDAYLAHAYVAFGAEVGKFGFKANLGGYNNSNIFRAPFEKTYNYWGFISTFTAMMRINAEHTLRLKFNRYAALPSAWAFVPYTLQTDDMTEDTGNPSLTPQTTNELELRYNFTTEGYSFYATPAYYHSSNIMGTEMTFRQDLGVATRTVNCGSRDMFAVVVGGSISPLDWFSFDAFLQPTYDIYNTFGKKRAMPWFYASANLSFFLPYDFSIRASANYRTKILNAIGYSEPSYSSTSLYLRKYFPSIGLEVSVGWWRPFYSSDISHSFSGDNYEIESYSRRLNSSGVFFRVAFYFVSGKELTRYAVPTNFDMDSRN